VAAQMALAPDSKSLNLTVPAFSSAIDSTSNNAFNVTLNDAFDNYFAAKFLL
jgi:hypothetical protein